MEKKIAIGLIKLEVLNNIDAQDSEALQYLKRNDDDFPWKEFGDYQNLVAILAVTSKIENPEPQLKQKIFSKLFSFKPKSEPDEIFEPAVIENDFHQNEEPVKFKFESNKTDNGPDIEIEEFDPDSKPENENKPEQQNNSPLIFNINRGVKSEEKPASEQLYEIEEYDLEMAHQEHIDNIREAENEEQTAEILSEKSKSNYEIEEYDLEVIDECISEKTEHSGEPISIKSIENETVVTESVVDPVIAPESVTPEDVIETDDEIVIYSEPETIDEIKSERAENVSDDEIVIYSEPETIEETKSEKVENVTEEIPEQPKNEDKPILNDVNPETLKIPVQEKNNDTKIKAGSSDSISFKEPNLSQLHSLFKDNQEIHTNEKSARAEYRSKVNKELAVASPKPEEVKPVKDEIVIEPAVNPEVKSEEIEGIHKEESHELKTASSDETANIEEKIKSPVKLKKERDTGSSKKVIVIAASILIVCAAVLFFMQSSGDVKGEQVKKTEQNNNQQVTTDTYTEVVEEKKPEGTVIVEDIKPVKQNNTTLLKPENKLPAPPKQPVLIEPEIVTEIKKENPTSELKEKTETKTETPPVIKEEKKVEEEPAYFVAVEEMPAPIGGLAGIQSRIIYPTLARTAGVEGKVLVLAYVNESGNVTKVELVKGIGAGCDEVALDAVRQTKFKPGLQRGKPVKVKITIPIVFKKN